MYIELLKDPDSGRARNPSSPTDRSERLHHQNLKLSDAEPPTVGELSTFSHSEAYPSSMQRCMINLDGSIMTVHCRTSTYLDHCIHSL